MSAEAAVDMMRTMEFLGLPIRYVPKMVDFDPDGAPYHGIAFARGFWPLKRIEVGRGWFQLSAGEQNAALAHEAGHCFGLHLEKRLLLVVFCWLPLVQRWARRQEFEADAFAVSEGYGSDLVRLLTRFWDRGGNALMPSPQERISNIMRILQENHHAPH